MCDANKELRVAWLYNVLHKYETTNDVLLNLINFIVCTIDSRDFVPGIGNFD